MPQNTELFIWQPRRNMISAVIFAGALTIFAGAPPPVGLTLVTGPRTTRTRHISTMTRTPGRLYVVNCWDDTRAENESDDWRPPKPSPLLLQSLQATTTTQRTTPSQHSKYASQSAVGGRCRPPIISHRVLDRRNFRHTKIISADNLCLTVYKEGVV